MKYKVLITTSGIGSRLGESTDYTNKSLIRIGFKPALSYIIELYPKNIEFIITTGYFEDHIKQFVKLAYPDRNITFVSIDKYNGPGSSLAYSMLKAKEYLQCPFIFHAGDTIVQEKIPIPDQNWSGGCKNSNSAQYSSFNTYGNTISEIKERGSTEYDYLHIGIVGIKDYINFWDSLYTIYINDPNNEKSNDCHAINRMIKKGASFYIKEFPTWLDMGNVESLQIARKTINKQSYVLDKIDESLYIFDSFVIKFFHDKKKVVQRVKRAKYLKNLVPEILGYTDNFYKYAFIKGDLYSRSIKPTNINIFLNWAQKNLWKRTKEVNDKQFHDVCLKFYKDKTLNRINKLLKKKSIKDTTNIINDIKVPAIRSMLSKINFEALAHTSQTTFHGDFILDNIIKTQTRFYLLDWRQNFGGLLKSGDIYYDLAKFNHNLTVNHDIINRNLFTIEISGNTVLCDILRPNNLVLSQEEYFSFLKKNGYDIDRVKMLTALIWLNMSPLHHHPLDLFLFYFGKLNLWRCLYEKKNIK